MFKGNVHIIPNGELGAQRVLTDAETRDKCFPTLPSGSAEVNECFMRWVPNKQEASDGYKCGREKQHASMNERATMLMSVYRIIER